MGDLSGIYGDGEDGGEEGLGRPKDAAEAVERMMRKRGFSRKINYGVIGSAYSSPRGSEAGGDSRRGSVVPPETSLSPSGEIIVVGEGGREGSVQGQAVAGAKEGGSREEAIEVEDEGEESEPDDYYDEEDDEDMEMEMAGVDEVLGRIGSDDEGDEDD